MGEKQRDWLPLLEWLKSLETLTFIELAPYGHGISSSFINPLCRFLFPPSKKNVKPTLRPHRCIWIQDCDVENY